MNAILATDAALEAARTFYDRHSRDAAVATTYGYFTHHPFARLNRKRLHLVAELVACRSAELGRALRVLDLASGGGLITCALAAQGHNAVGLDLSADEIRMARTFSSEAGLAGRFAQADLINDGWESEAESLLAGTPDVVTLAYALHHLPPDRVESFVGRLSGWLDPGAYVIVNEENPRSPVFRAAHRLPTRSRHDTDMERHRTPTAWCSMFSTHGFDVDSRLVAADMTPGVAAVAPSLAWSVLFTAHRRGAHTDPDQHARRNHVRDAYVPAGIMQRLAEGRDRGLVDFWRSRIDTHERETYAGIKMTKFPEDLRTYERIISERAPQVVIELGVHYGGSTLWLRDRLVDLQRYQGGATPSVIAVDIDMTKARASFAGLPPGATAGIELVEGDIRDDSVIAQIRRLIPSGAEVFIVEDAQHNADTTLAGLRGLAPCVSSGGYYMVEDTCVDVENLRLSAAWPRGAGLAVERWLADDELGRLFRRRPDLQPYGLTCHPGGLLQRVPGSTA